MSFKIQTMYAFVSEDEKGEGLIGMKLGQVFMPFVASDETRFRQLRQLADEVARANNKRVRVLKFENPTEIEVIEPNLNKA
jgi:hypothetical protein